MCGNVLPNTSDPLLIEDKTHASICFDTNQKTYVVEYLVYTWTVLFGNVQNQTAQLLDAFTSI